MSRIKSRGSYQYDVESPYAPFSPPSPTPLADTSAANQQADVLRSSDANLGLVKDVLNARDADSQPGQPQSDSENADKSPEK